LTNVSTFDDDVSTVQRIVVRLSHLHVVTQFEVQRIVRYQGAGANTPIDVVQVVTWFQDRDVITGVSRYWSDQGYAGVASPGLDAYTVDVDHVPGTSPAEATSSRPVDSEVVVTYDPIPEQLVRVVFLDHDTVDPATGDPTPVEPVVGTVTAFRGLPGATVGFTEEDALAGMPENYVFGSLDNVETFDEVADFDQVITINLGHQHATLDLPITRTIRYQGAGTITPEPVVQSITWQEDLDLVDEDAIYSSTTGYEPVDSPAISGYTVDVPRVAGTEPVVETTQAPVDAEVVVTYKVIPVTPLPITGPNAILPLLLTATALTLVGLRLIRSRKALPNGIHLKDV
jgi:hypothetical protein